MQFIDMNNDLLRQYIALSVAADELADSGTCKPCSSISSPVLLMMVMSRGSTTSTKPCRNFAAPTPPASTVIMTSPSPCP